MYDQGKDVAKEYFIARWPSWLRWVLFLPIAILGSVIASTLYNIVSDLGGTFFGVDTTAIYYQLASSAILGWAFVFAGAWMAPRNQFVISILLLVLLTLFEGYLFALSFNHVSSIGPMQFALNAFASLIAGGYVVYVFNEL